MNRLSFVCLAVLGCSGPSTFGARDGGAADTSNDDDASSLDAASAPDTSSADAAADAATSILPRLFVADDKIEVWNRASSLGDDATIDARPFGVSGPMLAISDIGGSLFAAGHGGNVSTLYRFDNAATLETGATPAGTVPPTAMGGPLASAFIAPASAALFLVAHHASGDDGLIDTFVPAGSLSSSSKPGAQLQSSGFVMTAGAHDDKTDRLFATGSGGVLVWDQASKLVGAAPASFTLATSASLGGSAAGVALDADRLYVAAGGGVRVWDKVSSAKGAASATFTLGSASHLDSAIADVEVRHDTLVVTSSSGSNTHVCIFRGASAITGDRAPDAEIDVLESPGAARHHTWIVTDGTLFVATSAALRVYGDATHTASLRATLHGVVANDIMLVE